MSSLIRGLPNKSLKPTGISEPLIARLAAGAEVSRRLSSGVMPLRIKTEAVLNKCGAGSLLRQLNGTINGRHNNSLNRSAS